MSNLVDLECVTCDVRLGLRANWAHEPVGELLAADVASEFGIVCEGYWRSLASIRPHDRTCSLQGLTLAHSGVATRPWPGNANARLRSEHPAAPAAPHGPSRAELRRPSRASPLTLSTKPHSPHT